MLAEHAAVYEDNALTDHVNRMCLADSRLFLPGLNLAYTDRASMAASTEVRVPFVDVDVVRAAFRFPGPEDRRQAGQGGAQARRLVGPAARDRLPAQGTVQRPVAGVDEP